MRSIIKKHWLLSGGGGVNYAPLYPYFESLIIPAVGPNYTNLSRTNIALDGDYVRGLTDVINDLPIQFKGSETRRSYLSNKYGSDYNLLLPVFKIPSRDYPHITFSNCLDMLFESASFAAVTNNNNSAIFVIRSRRSVIDEGGIYGGQVGIRDRGKDHLEIFNSGGSVELDAASGSPYNETDYVSIITVVAFNSSSRAYSQLNQYGESVTLPVSSMTKIQYGTNSHQWEHDLILAGGLKSSTDIEEVFNLLNTNYFPVTYNPDALVKSAHGYGITISFNTNTFTAAYLYGGDVAEDTSARIVEWICRRTDASIAGYTGLDNQHIIKKSNSLTLNRSQIPATFNGRNGTGVVYLSVRIKAFDTNGNSWGGIPFRSEYIFDNIVGTPSITGQAWIDSVTVENANADEIVIHLTSTSGGGTFSGGSLDGFNVYVNDVEVTPTIDLTDLSSGNIVLTLPSSLEYSDNVVVTYIPIDATTPLQNSLGFQVPLMQTGVFLPFTNNVSGPITMKVNLSWFVDGTTPPWQNLTADGSVSTIDADVADEGGSATGIALAVTNAFQGWGVTDKVGVGTLFDEANVVARGLNSNGSADTTGTLRFSGLTAGQTFDLSYAVYDTNGGAGSVTVTDGAGTNVQAIDSSVYTEYTKTSLTADASGNVDITVEITAAGKDGELIGVILTVYP